MLKETYQIFGPLSEVNRARKTLCEYLRVGLGQEPTAQDEKSKHDFYGPGSVNRVQVYSVNEGSDDSWFDVEARGESIDKVMNALRRFDRSSGIDYRLESL